jgi:hypothetical protein
MITHKKIMKVHYYQGKHIILQINTENPFKIIKIIKHINSPDNRFCKQQLFRKSCFSKKRSFRKMKSNRPHPAHKQLTFLLLPGLGGGQMPMLCLPASP